ncbi:MAG: hypothetical protein CME62_09770 [Halobacteriovoraceae bacterium]|nr:hypothetical protein [Halobacteriovoraceae bacterium]|tara:strand:- start:6627 stop:7274 length:648 start_codon:yes stop_codon:yes gene_type:complete
MVRYLKYIVIVFGSIGLLIASFFIYQNRVDIKTAWNFNPHFELEYLKKNCPQSDADYYYPCLRKIFQDYLGQVSLTGTNMGLKMVFSAMDEIKEHQTKYPEPQHAQIAYTLAYIDLNNLALDNAYRRYFGLSQMYGGFVASLGKYYPKAFEFSENLIIGLRSNEGLEQLADSDLKKKFVYQLNQYEQEYYRIKKEVTDFIEKESAELEASSALRL